MADFGTIGYPAYQFIAGFLMSPIPYGGPYFAPQYNDAEPVNLSVQPPVGRLESALLIRLGAPIRWEASVDEAYNGVSIASTGTLVTDVASAQFNPHLYLYRDRQLSYRDLMVASAVVDVSAQVSDVWNCSAPRPVLEGSTPTQLPSVPNAYLNGEGTLSFVRHVQPTSLSYAAIRYADQDLYGRDGLVFEILARAAGSVFSEPPIARIDPQGTIYPDTVVWSLAEGSKVRRDVSGHQQLDVNQFKVPDQHLAYRDNLVAGYAAQVMRVLQNPYAYAMRLYMEATGAEAREAEVYTLVSDTATERVWVADPALESRNRITYAKATNLITWARETLDEGHVPQLYAFSIPGIAAGQRLVNVPAVPSEKDAQFWRSKAALVVPSGGSVSDQIVMPFTASSAAQGGYTQVTACSLTVPGSIAITLPGDIDPGRHRVAVLVNPNPEVEIAGASNVYGVNGTLGGVDYAVDVASGYISTQTYAVYEGAGIVYDGSSYYPGQTFVGAAGITTYTQVTASNPSKVRLAEVGWSIALPPGYWNLSFDYTNLQYTTDSFGVTVQVVLNGGTPTEVIKDTVVQPFTTANGSLVTSSTGSFEIVDTSPFAIRVLWTSGTGQFHVRQLTMTRQDVETCRIRASGTLGVGAANVDVTSQAGQPETLLFELDTAAQSPAQLQLTTFGDPASDSLLPLQIKQITVQDTGTYNATPNADGFQSWRQECMDRAGRVVQQAYRAAVDSYGTNMPIFYTAGTSWTDYNSELWMSVIETAQPRLRELPAVQSGGVFFGRQYAVDSGTVVYDSGTYSSGEVFYAVENGTTFTGSGTIHQIGAFRKSNPGHLGKPCLVPYGIEIDGSFVSLQLPGSVAQPVVVSCQPWMIDAGFYTAQPEFWMPDML